MRIYLQEVLSPLVAPAQLDQSIEVVLKRSELNFMYLNFLRDYLREKAKAGEEAFDLDKIPIGLEGF